MRIVTVLLLLAVAGGAYHWWSGRDALLLGDVEPSPSGFVPVLMPEGVRRNTVVILAPENCPSDAAQRADALAAALTREGIPNVRSSRYSTSVSDPTRAQMAAAHRASAVLNGEIPAVFVNGMGKANPGAAEVVAEYRRTRGGG